MKTVAVRELSGELITRATAQGQTLGVTNRGSLAGVLIPFTRDVLGRIANRDAADIRRDVHQAEAELASGESLSTLSELLDDSGRSTSSTSFSRVTIRELSGRRLEQAATDGKALVVTSGGITVALLIPVTASWVERLVEGGIGRFLDGDAAVPPAAVVPAVAAWPGAATHLRAAAASRGVGAAWSTTETLSRRAGSGRDFLLSVAIGIQITSDASANNKRLVGVVTDMLAQVVAGPLHCNLESTEESHVLAQILNLIDELRPLIGADKRLVGLGLEIGGHVDQGRVIYSPNAHWTQFPLAERLTSILGLPVVLENDANALAIYERRFTGIEDYSFAVIVLTEVGVGCGLILDGQIYRGVRGMAGELGHVPVVLGDREDAGCRCVNRGCLECVATPHAIELALPSFGFEGGYEEALQSSSLKPVGRAFAAAGASFGRAIVSVINVINPSAIVFYGPSQLLGAPGTLQIEGKRDSHIESNLPASGVARHYTKSMIEAIRQNAFSTGASDCRFIVRTSADLYGARAAAACLIDKVALAPSARQQTEIPNIVVMT